MKKLFEVILKWAEVWAPLFPIFSFLAFGNRLKLFRLIYFYFLSAFVLNLIAIIIWQKGALGLNLPFTSNVPIYNFHSIVRFAFFAVFFIQLNQPFLSQIKRQLFYCFTFFLVFDLIFLESFNGNQIANFLHAAEAACLLLYCLSYYLFVIQHESVDLFQDPTFWIVTGLCIFVIVSFPVYLFYKNLISNYLNFSIDIWLVPKTAFVIFCLITAFGFYLIRAQKQLTYE